MTSCSFFLSVILMSLQLLACNEKLLKRFGTDCCNKFYCIDDIKLWIQKNVLEHEKTKQGFFDAIKYIASYPETTKTYFDGYTFNEDLALHTYITFGYLNNIPKVIPQRLKLKNVVFYNRENKYNSLIKLRIFHLSKHLRVNDSFKVNVLHNVHQLSNSIVIISKVRFSTTNIFTLKNELFNLKRRNNVLAFDIIDSFVDDNIHHFMRKREVIEFLKLFDILLCTSYHEKKIMSKYVDERLLFVLYHQWDEEMNKDVHLRNNNRVYYVGQIKKIDNTCISLFQKKKLNHLLVPIPEKMYKSFHFTYVPANNIYHDTHTSTKLATAAMSHSPLICNRIPVFTELLPSDYPLFINNEREREKIIDYSKRIYGTKEHVKLLKIMNSVKDRLSPQRIGKDLYDILKVHVYLSV